MIRWSTIMDDRFLARYFGRRHRCTATAVVSLAFSACMMEPAAAKQAEPTDLADQPLRVVQTVPANVLLGLSVEWPTGNVQAYNDEAVNGCPGRDGGFSVCYFDPITRAQLANTAGETNALYKPKRSLPYIGYFDPFKCYDYAPDAASAPGYFNPIGFTSGYDPVFKYTDQPTTATATCTGKWSGNFLNWATSQTIDIFRWAMTGGDRSVDTIHGTILEKARHDGQGGTGQFPDKRIGRPFGIFKGTAPSTVSPFTSAELTIAIQGLNTTMRVTPSSGTGGDFLVRVKVCDKQFPESATPCTRYSPPGIQDQDVDPASIVLKPTGLIQDNAMSVRFAAMGYLLDDDQLRDGGVLRARMKFVGPDSPQNDGRGKQANPNREWDDYTGIYRQNPDSADANATNAAYSLASNSIDRSGVIQYLNKFGRVDGYKNHDPVSEMFYEGLRYFKFIGPTPEYTDMGLTGGTSSRKVDGFPVITSWDDPMAPPDGFQNVTAWCPKNFFVDIADANTHKDKRLPGNTAIDAEKAAQPTNPDASLNVVTLLSEIIASGTVQRRRSAPELLRRVASARDR
jgi:type IV pilus assembly protein PilY1